MAFIMVFCITKHSNLYPLGSYFSASKKQAIASCWLLICLHITNHDLALAGVGPYCTVLPLDGKLTPDI